MLDKQVFENKSDGLVVRLKIIPNSSKNDIFFDGEILKIKLTAQPIENKANKALIEFLAKKLSIPKSSVEILKGQTSKDKTIFIKNFSKDKFLI